MRIQSACPHPELGCVLFWSMIVSRHMIELNRRTFLTTALASLAVEAFSQSSKPYRLDIHHHFGPPVWVAEVKGRPLLQPANTTWTAMQSIEDMDRGGVAASVISITNPGLWFGDKAVTTRVARGCNA